MIDVRLPVDTPHATATSPDRVVGRWFGPWEASAVFVLASLFFFGFILASPVNGYIQQLHDGWSPDVEIFDQDSSVIMDTLVQGTRYKWNPQDHLLYHFLTEGIYYRLVRPHTHHSLTSVFLFLKVFTVSTALLALILLSRLLWEMGVGRSLRVILILLFGVFVYLLALHRLGRERTFRWRNGLLLGTSLAFLLLCRLDLVRFFAQTAVLVALPPFRSSWRQLSAVVLGAFVLGLLALVPLVAMYQGVPVSRAPQELLRRTDSTRLAASLATTRNITLTNVSRMALATTVSAVIMPVGPDKFRGPLTGMAAHPLAVLTLLAYATMIGVAGYVAWRDRRRTKPLLSILAVNWCVGLALYVWFNPHEPFLWLLEFLPFVIVLVASAFKDCGTRTWSLVGAALVLVMLHNTLYFYLIYQ
jgi:hypothetical protein